MGKVWLYRVFTVKFRFASIAKTALIKGFDKIVKTLAVQNISDFLCYALFFNTSTKPFQSFKNLPTSFGAPEKIG